MFSIDEINKWYLQVLLFLRERKLYDSNRYLLNLEETERAWLKPQ